MESIFNVSGILIFPFVTQIVHALIATIKDKDPNKRLRYATFLIGVALLVIFLYPLHQAIDLLGKDYFYAPLLGGVLSLMVYHLSILEGGKKRKQEHHV